MKKNSFTNLKVSFKWLSISLTVMATIIVVGSCKKGKTKDTPPEKENPVVEIVPNDGKDDTRSIQNAIDEVAKKGGGTLTLPAGDYNVNADSTINLKSNVTLSMADDTRLIAAPNKNQRYYVIKITNAQNAKVLGGQIIGDRDTHLGTGGEWGYGISVAGGNNVLIKDLKISNCWGDGVGVGGYMGTRAKNVTLKNIVSDNNRRQGLSIFDVDGLVIDSCQFSNTNGTKPMDGIDIEPDAGTAENITITNCRIFNNIGNGIEINAKASTTAVVRNITVQKNEIFNNAYSGYLANGSNVNFTENWLYSNKYLGNRVYNKNCPNSLFEPNTYSKKP